jgi:ATP-dependent Clp protease adapter protein ClpS
MPVTEEIKISEGILNQINSISAEDFTIKAFNNDHTPFQLVFIVLNKVVPMEAEEAYNTTMLIHTQGEAILYTGSKDHCEKIGRALETIKVAYEIY